MVHQHRYSNISFLFERRGKLTGSQEQFLLFGVNIVENLDAAVKFLKILVKDLEYLES